MNRSTRDPATRSAVIRDAEELLAAGRGRDAVDTVTTAVRSEPDPHIEQFLVRLRHRAAAVAAGTPTLDGEWPGPRPDIFDQPGVPEVPVEDLTADLLAAALQHRGCLHVRRFFDADTTDRLLDDAQRALEAADQVAHGGSLDDAAPWYAPFEAEESFEFGSVERQYTRNIGGVLSVDAPRPLLHLIEAFREIGFGDVLADYLGEWPMVSAKKSTLRKATPSSPTEWHQDGAFLGTGTRTVNSWVALTPCGVDAPGMDVFPQRFDHIVETGTDSALYAWSVSSEQAERVGSGHVSPVFDAGDALLFDQMTLHRSGIDPAMTRDRYAIESWFFAPSQFPYEQVPILF